MPCTTNTLPDRLYILWRLNIDAGGSSASRMIKRSTEVRALYKVVCRQTLVKYDYPIAFSCPRYLGKDLYHLHFMSSRRTLLSVTEKAEGCFFMSIDGRPGLGFSTGMWLPKGVPAPRGLPPSQVI
jgi:hypothetical protein